MTFLNAHRIPPRALHLSRLSDERGLALVVAMVLVAMLAFLGAAALLTSSTEMDIAGNERAYQEAFYTADGGSQLAPRVIRNILSDDLSGYGSAIDVDVNCLQAELLNFSGVSDGEGNPCNDDTDVQTTNPDIQATLTATGDVRVDVDRLGTPRLLPGGGVEFGAGHDGVGAGSASGGSVRHYQNNSQSLGARNANSLIQTRYRYVIGVSGGS